MSLRIGFTLTGTMPLLMHADNIEGSDELQAWRKDPAHKNVSVAGDDRSPPWTWQTYLYHDGEHVCMPSDNLTACLRYAGAQVIMKKQKTFKEATQSRMLCEGEFLTFTTGGHRITIADVLEMRDNEFRKQMEKCEKLGFRLWMKRARVGQSKHVRVRPRFETWEVAGSLQATAPELTYDVVKQLFDIAGGGGLCDWRPNCKTPGPYGMFTAKLKRL